MTTIAPADEEAVDADAIAAEYNCSRESVYRLANAGKIPGFKVGRLSRCARVQGVLAS